MGDDESRTTNVVVANLNRISEFSEFKRNG
jgi:hypothetical protein